MSSDSTAHAVDRNLATVIAHVLHPPRLFANTITVIVIWLVAVILATSFSALIFHGRLAPFYGTGISMVLVSGTIITLMIALFGSDHATLGFPQSTAAAILGAMAANLVASAPATMSDDTLFFTVVLTISLASILTGLFFLILGVLRAGNLIRYIPYPVIGGFLAGSGWLLVQGAFNMMVGVKLRPDTLTVLLDSPVLERWLPGMLLAVVLLGLLRRTGNVLLLPTGIIGALLLFYALLFSSGSDIDTATQAGWFLEEFSAGTMLRTLDFDAIAQVDGALLLAQAGSMAALIIISTLHMLLNASGLELVVDRELDLNHELTIIGAGNALSGVLGGGIIGFPSVTFTTLAHRMGSHGRFVGVMLSLLLGLGVIFGASLIALFPRVVLAGLLMYVGFSFLAEWLYDAWFKLPLQDYLIMFAIFLVIGLVGFLQGVAVGFVATIVLFVLEYSRISIIKQEFSGSSFRSNIDRSFEENAVLQDLGQHIWVLRMQGFIFFGTSHQFFQRIKARVLDRDQEALLYVILDFRLVHGIDVSAVVDFTRLKQLARMHGIRLLMADIAPPLQEILVDCGFGPLESDVSYQFDDLDHAMEWCENELLSHADFSTGSRVTLQEQFDSRTMVRALDVTALARYLERVEVGVGEFIMHQGDEPDSLYFIESGRIDIQLEMDDGKAVRLRSMSAGTIVGEVGFYLGIPRSASVIVTEPGIFLKLTRDALHRLEQDDPESAGSFHVFIVCVVAERLSGTNHIVQALMN